MKFENGIITIGFDEMVSAWVNWRGRCFDAAFLMQQVHTELELHHGTFIHGPHAWCQDADGNVFDATQYECWRLNELPPPADPDEFFHLLDAETDIVYLAEDALRLATEHEHFGPWR